MLKDKKIVFFYEDEDILIFVKSIVDTEYFLPIHLHVTDLPTYEFSDDYLTSCKNQDNIFLQQHNDMKGIIHYWRDFRQSGEDCYRKIISIWTSKILLVDRVIQTNPYSTDAFAWVDVSMSRFNNNYIKKNYNPSCINTPPNKMSYMGEKITNNAAFMISTKAIWLLFITLYKAKLQALRHSNYAHDEETIIYLIYKEHPQLLGIIE
jgi:hypothetical protein